MAKTVALASDHGGFELKNHIKDYLEEQGFEVIDFGSLTHDSVDYVDFAKPACKSVLNGECDCALLFCGTGVGMSIAANKINGIRACCCSDTFSAEMTRRHNNANALCLGGRVIGFGLARVLVDTFLKTGYDGGHHQRRIDKIHDLEKS